MPTSTKIGIQPQEKANQKAQRNDQQPSPTDMPLQLYKKISLPVLQQADRLGLRTWPLFPAIAPLGINKTAPQRCYNIVGVQFW